MCISFWTKASELYATALHEARATTNCKHVWVKPCLLAFLDDRARKRLWATPDRDHSSAATRARQQQMPSGVLSAE